MFMDINPMIATDFYKVFHKFMSEPGTEKIYSTFTPRHSRIDDIQEVVFFGLQGFIKDFLLDFFNKGFFNLPKHIAVADYKRTIKYTIGDECADTTHIEALHDLGHFPIEIRAVKEGTFVPIKVPPFTVENTDKDYYWLPLYLETLTSAETWPVIVATTIARKYRDICEEWAEKTCEGKDHIQWQCHNFSYRGMHGFYNATTTGAGHLLFFTGTDTIPSISYLERFYNANIENELVGSSVRATEHSIQCGYRDDLKYITRMITEVAPSGIVSVVADGYDYWGVLGDVMPKLKDTILARDGKVVIRPDSGDPIEILCGNMEVEDLTDNEYCKTLEECKRHMQTWLVEDVREETPHGKYGNSEPEGIFKFGDKHYKIVVEIDWNRRDYKFYYIDEHRIKSCEEIELTLEQKGSVEVLWDLFGGAVNKKGYRVLNPHIGLIYGDSITPEIAKEVFRRLAVKGFASENVVFGVGSYSLGYYTRDTFAFAMKATHTIINEEEIFLFKDPKTDTDKIKKSQTGMVVVLKDTDGTIRMIDGLNAAERDSYAGRDLLEVIFRDGKLIRDESLSEIRARVLK